MHKQISTRTAVVRILAAACLIVCCNVTLRADNWSQFRGPDANSVSTKPLPTTWSDHDGATQNIRWKIPVAGEGWSQPVVWGKKVFLTAAVPMSQVANDPEPYSGGGGRSRKDLMKTDYRYQVVCVDANSGDEVWRTTCKEGKPPIPRHNTNTYATETPVTDGERIYAYFGMNGIYALDMQGKVLWQKDLGVFLNASELGNS